MHQPHRQYTLDDYFSLERGVDLKLEYFNGDIFVMPSGTIGHNRINLNVLTFLHRALSGSSSEVFGVGMRVSTPSGLYTYPDASIICGPLVDGTAETIADVIALVEILSDITRNFDRGDKFEHYRSIPTLRHYLLIEPSFVHVEHRRLEADGSWSHEIAESVDQVVHLSEVGVDLPVARIYEDLELATARPQG
ncbi:MAG TPA: Uma2 family endonuclease [Thermoanaerobaculia bacterium]|nr:Uma2 family endonuclease [Thermoanaerobaculia bacterium]